MASSRGSSNRSSTRGEPQQEGFRLSLLGGAFLEGSAGTVSGRAVQRRRMALLALLAVARQRGVSRDKLVFYLWPDNEPERARHLLSDSLYTLNKALGTDAILSVGDQLRLNDRVVHSDVAAFEDALEQRDWEAAVELYRGAFLEGTYLCSNQEWERWLDHERDRYAQAFGKALEAAARERGARGDLTGAVELWRRAAVNDPTDSRIAISVMLALETAGNRTAAFQHAKIHEAMVREELDVPVPPEVHALVERLRTQPAAAAPVPPAAPPGESPVTREAEPDPEPTPEPFQPERPREVRPVAARLSADTRPWRRTLWVAPVLLILLTVLWFTNQTRSAPQTTAASISSIAVFPFSVRGADTLTYLGEGMVDLLSTKLDGLGDIRAVDPRAILGLTRNQQMDALDPQRARSLAQQLGATHYVLGNILQVGERLQVNASLYGHTGDLQATAEFGAKSESQLFELVDRLTVQLVAGQSSGPTAELTRLAALTTSSLPALKAFLSGERSFRHQQYGAAVDAFHRAIDLDSTFALAAYRLSIAADWTAQHDLSEEAIERAGRFRQRLPEVERLLVEAMLAFGSSAPLEAERRYRTVLRRYPGHIEASYRLAETQYHHGPLLGHSPSQAEATFRHVLRLDPDHGPARSHLAYLAAHRGDRVALDTLMDRLLAQSPADSLEWLTLRAFALNDSAMQERLAPSWRVSSDSALWMFARNIALRTPDPGRARPLAHLLTDPDRNPDLRVAGHLLLAWLEMAGGRPRAAQSRLDLGRSLSPAAALAYQAVFLASGSFTASPAALRTIRDSLAAWEGTAEGNPYLPLYADMRPRVRNYLLGLLSAQLGDEEGIHRYLAALQPAPGDTSSWLANNLAKRRAAIQARVAELQGNPAAALTLLEQRTFPGVSPPEFPGINFFERQIRPGLLRSAGRDAEALRWYAAVPWTGTRNDEVPLMDLVHLAPFHFAQGEILEQLGRGREAARHYARFLELWRDAEPELQPQVTEARRRLARLRRGG